MAWERLAHVELSSSGDTLDSGTFTAKKNMKVIIYTVASGTINHAVRYNSDSGSNYAYRRNVDDGSDTAEGSQSSDPCISSSSLDVDNTYAVGRITNIAAQEKITMWDTIFQNADGAGSVPRKRDGVAKWANTSAQITRITVSNSESGSYDAGSYITILGAKEPGTSDTITVDSLEAKKHLMVQAKLIASGNIEAAVRFNNDSGNNYSTRYSVNGSESTGTSKNSIDTNLTAGGNEFVTYNVINEATKEKLVISELIDSNTSGAGTAPQRVEVVGKWANTSNAITRVDLVNVSTGDFAEGSEVTVYGTD